MSVVQAKDDDFPKGMKILGVDDDLTSLDDLKNTPLLGSGVDVRMGRNSDQNENLNRKTEVVQTKDGVDFPKGIKVLVVDNDPTSLEDLKNKLLECRYKVTTTNRAIMALKLLRDNKNEFDMVFADVCMPDMDGFELLCRLRPMMDMHVLLMSSEYNNKLVMKANFHGAAGQNKSKHQNNSDSHKRLLGSGGAAGMGNFDQNGKLNQKRKDRNELRNENPSPRKKPNKSLADYACTKYLDLMNVEKSTRGNVAHPKIEVYLEIVELIKVEKLTRENVVHILHHHPRYEIRFKEMFGVEPNQIGNMVADLGSMDTSHPCMDSFNGIGNFYCALAGPGQFEKKTLRSLSPESMLLILKSIVLLGRCVGHNSENTANQSTLKGLPWYVQLNIVQRTKQEY